MPDNPSLEKEISDLLYKLQRSISSVLPPDYIAQLKQGVKIRIDKLNETARDNNLPNPILQKVEALNILYERSDYYLR